ncbi:MAG: NAD(P)-dependent oxidoreductase [Bauldia sp.]|nr:NAD(P)-dependent oxidoreductase [Bauldia sp.]
MSGDRLLIFGLGYSAAAFVATGAGGTASIVGTTRSTLPAVPGVSWLRFDGTEPVAAVSEAIRSATRILVSAPPDEAGDPVLRHHAGDIAAAPALRGIVYLSTVGVYGDHGGAWVDEGSETRPVSRRSVQRLAAEQSWRALGEAGVPVALLRLAGIYGPGRNALVNVAEGTARRIVKPGQVFNRIHVADIATAIGAAFAARLDGPLNVADDEPGPPQDVVAFAAALLGVAAPPEVPFDAAALSPMARSFYGENKRVRNDRLKALIGKALSYPTYREGLTALFAAGEGRGDR